MLDRTQKLIIPIVELIKFKHYLLSDEENNNHERRDDSSSLLNYWFSVFCTLAHRL